MGDPKIIQVIVDIGDFSWGKQWFRAKCFGETHNVIRGTSQEVPFLYNIYTCYNILANDELHI